MRKLRLLIFITCGVISSFETFAQTFAIKTGVNLSTMHTKDSKINYSGDYTLTPGLLFGVATELPINQKFSFETGLLFSSKGFQLDSEYRIYETSEPINLFHKTILNYIDIPLSLKTTTSFFRLPIYGMIGPYVGVGLNGKIIGDEYNGTVTERKEFKFRIVSDGDWKRFDYGLQLGAGILMGKFDFGLNYAYGLANITKKSTLVTKNRIIGLTVGYKFKSKNTVE